MFNRLKKKLRLFKSQLRLLDYLIFIAVIVILGALLIIRYSQRSEWINIQLKISADEWWWDSRAPEYWYVRNLEVGQVSYNAFNDPVAEITDTKIFDVGLGRNTAFVNMRMKVAKDEKKGVYLFNYQPLQVGKPLDLTFGGQNLRGIVTYVGSEEIEYVEKTIGIELRKKRPWAAEQVVPGLEAYDSEGRVIAEVLDSRVTIAESFEFSDIRGRMVLVNNPEFRDIKATVKVKAIEADGTYYFLDGSAIKVDEEIWFFFPEFILQQALITEVVE